MNLILRVSQLLSRSPAGRQILRRIDFGMRNQKKLHVKKLPQQCTPNQT